MKSTDPLTAERLRSLLCYEPDTGVWTWLADRKTGRGNGRVHMSAGAVAGGLTNPKGYRKIGIDGKPYYTHRLAFLWMTGSWPTQHVDHIDGNGGNCAWANLRDVSRSQNLQNRRSATRTSRTGFLGVTFNKRAGKFAAQISTSGTNIGLGYFETPEEAHQAYLAAKRHQHTGCTI